MAINKSTIVNDKVYDFTCVEISLPGFGNIETITDISYSHSIERGEFRGTSPYVRARTPGQYSAEGSFTIEKQTHAALVAELAKQVEGGRISDARFNITITYANQGMPLTTDELIDCSIDGESFSASEGTDPLSVEVTLGVGIIKTNGVQMLGNRQPY